MPPKQFIEMAEKVGSKKSVTRFNWNQSKTKACPALCSLWWKRAVVWFSGGFLNVTHENYLSNIILIFLCVCLPYCSSGSCQLLSMCATACSEQLGPRRWQRKPVLTCSKCFEPGKFVIKL